MVGESSPETWSCFTHTSFTVERRRVLGILDGVHSACASSAIGLTTSPFPREEWVKHRRWWMSRGGSRRTEESSNCRKCRRVIYGADHGIYGSNSAPNPHDMTQNIEDLTRNLLSNSGMSGLELLNPDEVERATQIFYRDGFVVIQDVLTSEQVRFLRSGCEREANPLLRCR